MGWLLRSSVCTRHEQVTHAAAGASFPFPLALQVAIYSAADRLQPHR